MNLLRIVKKIFLKSLFFITGIFVLLVFLAHSSLVPDGHGLTMLTFVQPLWTLPFALISFFCGGAVGFRLFGRSVLFVQFLSLLLYEDFHISRSPQGRPLPLIFPSLRVMAWNVQYYDSGFGPVLEAIKESEPDVVLLSEHIIKKQFQELFEIMAYPYRLVTGPHGDAAVLTRLPILETEEVFLPSRQTNLVGANLMSGQILNPRRSFIRVKVDVGGVPVDVISVRFVAGRAASESPLDTVPWGYYLWETQRREVKAFRGAIDQLGFGHYIFGGDLNAPPSSWTIRQMREVGRDAYMEHHWFGDYTFRSKIFRFQKKKNMPMIRLDYLFASPEVTTEKIVIRKINLSDHDALIGDFMVPRLHRPSTGSLSKL